MYDKSFHREERIQNMKKRILSTILAVVMTVSCFVFTGCGETKTEPALWLMEKNGTKIYFFGSIHIADETMYPLPNYVNDAYEASDYLAVEYDIVREEEKAENMTEKEQLAYAAQFLYTDGTTVRDHMTEAQYLSAKQFLEDRGLYYDQLDYFHLCMWESTISSAQIEESGYEHEMGIDRHFIKRAHESGKPVLDIESEQLQIDMMLSFPDIITAGSIEEMVSMDEQTVKMQYAYLLDVYKRGRDDLLDSSSALSGFTMSMESEEYQAAYEEYNQKMLVDRNIGMKDKAIEYLNDGKNVFYVVGFAHMCGDDGIIELLKVEGYEVKRID